MDLRVRGLKFEEKHSTEVIDKTWKRVSNRFIYPNYMIFVRKQTQQISQLTTL